MHEKAYIISKCPLMKYKIIGPVLYLDLKKLTENTSEQYPEKNTLKCNPMDLIGP